MGCFVMRKPTILHPMDFNILTYGFLECPRGLMSGYKLTRTRQISGRLAQLPRAGTGNEPKFSGQTVRARGVVLLARAVGQIVT